ncbi:hypothetical protein LXA43DRAFT_334990 [Ganoderma leucocontextum]|nr:hypothetical protein LXA43DRAFT_334990 [Ganoderma leucocontextum]
MSLMTGFPRFTERHCQSIGETSQPYVRVQRGRCILKTVFPKLDVYYFPRNGQPTSSAAQHPAPISLSSPSRQWRTDRDNRDGRLERPTITSQWRRANHPVSTTTATQTDNGATTSDAVQDDSAVVTAIEPRKRTATRQDGSDPKPIAGPSEPRTFGPTEGVCPQIDPLTIYVLINFQMHREQQHALKERLTQAIHRVEAHPTYEGMKTSRPGVRPWLRPSLPLRRSSPILTLTCS